MVGSAFYAGAPDSETTAEGGRCRRLKAQFLCAQRGTVFNLRLASWRKKVKDGQCAATSSCHKLRTQYATVQALRPSTVQNIARHKSWFFRRRLADFPSCLRLLRKPNVSSPLLASGRQAAARNADRGHTRKERSNRCACRQEVRHIRSYGGPPSG
jgi:hypothetical protein